MIRKRNEQNWTNQGLILLYSALYLFIDPKNDNDNNDNDTRTVTAIQTDGRSGLSSAF